MQNLYSFIEYISASLLIKKPVELRILSKTSGKEKGFAAFCDSRFRDGKLVKHVLVFNTFQMERSKYDYLTIIAHEMVHASMIENGLFDNDYHHNKLFQKLAAKLESSLQEYGYKVEGIYNPQTDTD